MNKSISFIQAIEGFELNVRSRYLSQGTVKDYFTTFRKFFNFLEDDPPIELISSKHVERFLASQENISNKTLLNYHRGLSALWTWCIKEDLVKDHIVQKVDRPKPEKKSIVPYTQVDVKAMLEAVGKSMIYSRPGKKESCHTVTHPERNRAIILLLLDTGIRATELCDLKIHNTDLKNRRITVMGKGSKQRTIPISARTGQMIWRYLTLRKNARVNEPLFATRDGRPINRDQLLKALRVIGKRAGIAGVNVHRFRHTFAVSYLRNGGDPFSLQIMLGHSTKEMVKNYLSLAQADLEKNHMLASPVDNWRL